MRVAVEHHEQKQQEKSAISAGARRRGVVYLQS